MSRQFNRYTRKNLLLHSICMLLVCFGLVAGTNRAAHAAISETTTTPVLESAQVIGGDVVLTWSQPESVYGAPEGGYDIFVNGKDGNNHLDALTHTVKGLEPGEHTFQIEARYLQTREFNRSNVLSVVIEEAPAAAETTTTPVLESAQVVGTDVVLTWSQPDTTYGAPEGGYDIFVNGKDGNNHLDALTHTVKGLEPGEHTFQVEARYLQTREFNRSNVLSVVIEETPVTPEEPATPEEPSVPEEPTVSETTTTPVLESAQVVGTDVVLTWSQPESVYGAPEGGYDIFVNGKDGNNHLDALTHTVKGLEPGEHTFQVEARYLQTREFNRSNVLSVVIEKTPVTPEEPATPEEPSVPEEPTVSETTTTPVLESVQVKGSDVVLTWSQPESVYGAPEGGYDIFVNGKDGNNHLKGLTHTVKGLAGGEHTFQVEARYLQTGEFNRSNVMSVTIEGGTEPEPDPTPSDPVVNDPIVNDPSLGYLPVFPGAQGFGTETKAGRGGKIIKVTNLNDSGSGSLRAAIDASGPRIIVFEVSGTIKLGSDLKVSNPYVTIAGQTAPSPGIMLRGAALSVHAHDVLVQHLRVRVGDDSGGASPSNRDGIRISGSKTEVYNVVLDHLSVSWAIDETGSTPYAPHDITISNSILSEALNDSIHPQGTHSKGFLVREDTMNFSLVGNLFAHNKDRNPRVTGNSKVVAVNNVLYNPGRNMWFDVDAGRASKPHQLSVVGNVFIEGPNTPSNSAPIMVQSTCASGTKVYENDNVAGRSIITNKASFDPKTSSRPVWHPSLKPVAGRDAENRVLAYAGARPADRDSVDKRVVNEVKSRSGSIPDSLSQVGGWPNLAKNTRTFNAPSNPNGDDDGDGYTNIEEVLHQMAAAVEGR